MDQPINFDLVADLYDSYVNVDFDLAFYLEETSTEREIRIYTPSLPLFI